MVQSSEMNEDEYNPLEDMLGMGTQTFDDDDSQPLLKDKNNTTSAYRVPEQSAFADVENLQRNRVAPKQQRQQTQKRRAQYSDEDEEHDEEYGAECDPDGSVAICDACNRVLPLSKYEKHVSFFCKKQISDCPFCGVKFPSGILPEHMDACKKISRDPNEVTCKYCQQKMQKEQLKDHAIAHLVHQKQVERQLVNRVAEINAFHEEEKLENADRGMAPVLTKKQLAELPISEFEVTEAADENDMIVNCSICQMDLEDGVQIRTTLCFHLFHVGCIDRWLTTVQGSCVVCKVIQVKKAKDKSPSEIRANHDATLRARVAARQQQQRSNQAAQNSFRQR